MSRSDGKPIQLWAIGTVRNEVDIIRVNVLHHLSEGVDRFLLLDNGSTDGTQDVLHDLSLQFPLEWQASSSAFNQQQLLTELARAAASRGADWIIPIDADEFWYAPGASLRQVLADCQSGALRVDVVNFVQRRERLDAGADALADMVWRTASPQGTPDTIADLVDSGAIAYVEIAYPPKWAVRASEGIVIGWGNHDVSGFTGEASAATNIVCLHAPLRSKADLVRKLDLNRPAEEVGDYLERAWHLKRWRKLAAEGRLDSEWQANSHESGTLEREGDRCPLVEDHRLRQLVAAWAPRDAAHAAPGAHTPHVARIVAGAVAAARGVDGWFETEELELLARAVWRAASQVLHPPTVVEVGSYCGRSTVALGTMLKAFGAGAVLHAIDPHDGELGAIDSAIGLGTEPSTFPLFDANLQRHELAATVRVIRARSTSVSWQEPIDFLLVDGLHDYDGVLCDILHFEPWFRRGASIAFHDYGDTFPGVQAVVHQMLATHMYVLRERVASLVVLQRVGEGQGLREHPQEPVETRVAVRNQTIAILRQRVSEHAAHQQRTLDALTACRAVVAETERALGEAIHGIEWLEQSKRELLESRSWRWTAPLRAALRLLRRT